MIFIDCITDDFVQSETHLGYYYYYTGTRKDFISLLPKVKIYPTTRFLTGFSWLYLIIFVIIWVKSKNEVICDPTQLSDCCLLNFRSPRSSTTPLSQYFILTVCTSHDLSIKNCGVKSNLYWETCSERVGWICRNLRNCAENRRCGAMRAIARCSALCCSQVALLDNIIVPHCYHLVPHRVKAELLRFTSH